MQNITITSSLGSGHSYTGQLSPCDGSFTATGQTSDGVNTWTETVNGVLTASTLDYTSHYTPKVYGTDYSYWVTATRAGSSWTGTWSDSPGWTTDSPTTGTVNVGSNATNYKSHGEYVAANGGGDDAAHACIGMPVQSQA
jgi:hypothetical protein